MRHVLTLIASEGSVIPPEFVRKFGTPHWLAAERACDLFFDEPPTFDLPADLPFDAVLQPADQREKRLLISDMDSTMIQQECIDELADLVGKRREVSAITERAMRGEIDFKAALVERVALLKGLQESDLERVYRERITLMPGACVLVQTMRARGAYTLLVSGGFTFFTSLVRQAIGFHADEANQLEMQNGLLTGRVLPPILDKDAKRETLLRVTNEKSLSPHETLAVGDGANDIPMLKAAGLGVAYHAKPTVCAQTRAHIHKNDLSALLFLQGISQEKWCAA